MARAAVTRARGVSHDRLHLSGHGGVCLLTPSTDAAAAWCGGTFPMMRSTWAPPSPSGAYVADILTGITDDGSPSAPDLDRGSRLASCASRQRSTW